MKITITCDNGANIHSRRKATVDTDDLGYDAESWKDLSEDQKSKAVWDWLTDIGWIEVDWREVE